MYYRKGKQQTKEETKMWHEGTIGIKINKGTESKIAHYWVKAYEEGSEFGIDGGRISKLQIRINGQTVVNYDRGWDIEPDENDEAAQIAYAICLHDYN